MGLFDKFKGNTQQPQRTRRTDAVSGIPFPAYNGREPYMFISYAHANSPIVFSLIAEYYDQGYNVWYDEGIEPGIEWPEEIGKALGGSALFVVFVSRSAVISANVRNEINFAIKRSIPFIAVYIEETELSVGLDLQIGTRQAIMWYKMDKESYRRKYAYSFDSVLKPGRKTAFLPVPPEPVRQQSTPPPPSATAQPSAPPPAATQPPATASSPLPQTAPPLPDVSQDCQWIGSKLISYMGHAKELTLPMRTSYLYSNAFRNNDTIEKIVVPSSVSTIDFAAFDNCPNLKLVVIEGGYVNVGSPVATSCPHLQIQCHRGSLTHTNLKQAFTGPITFFPGEDFDIEHGLLNKYHGSDRVVRLPKEVEIIGGFAFSNCPNLESVIYTNDSGAILVNAFIGCANLRNITIGKHFTSIAPKAFIGCPYVRFSYYSGQKPDRFDTLFPDPSIAYEIEES